MSAVASAAEVYRHLYARKIRAFRMLYEFTYGSCGACVSSNCACKDRICQHVEERSLEVGVSLPRGTHATLRFIGAGGCVVPPHLRETCTIYLCGPAQTRAGFEVDRYTKLRRICDRIEWRLMELEETHGRGLARAVISAQ